jgi:hypothetical protein
MAERIGGAATRSSEGVGVTGGSAWKDEAGKGNWAFVTED